MTLNDCINEVKERGVLTLVGGDPFVGASVGRCLVHAGISIPWITLWVVDMWSRPVLGPGLQGPVFTPCLLESWVSQRGSGWGFPL
jgi:hypothetical protein